MRVVIDGQIHRELSVGEADWKHEEELECGQGSWVAAECMGAPTWHYPRGLWAHTNPVYLPGCVAPAALSDTRQYWDQFARDLEQYLATRQLEEAKRRQVLSLTGRLWCP